MLVAPEGQAPTPTPFGVLVKKLREGRGISQNALNQAAGLSSGYVSQLESGQRGKRPSREKVLAIAQGLQADAAETEALLRAANLHNGGPLVPPGRPPFRSFVMGDPLLRIDQKRALIATYESYVGRSGH